VPAQQQIYDDHPSPISQAVQIWGEGPEISPYATYFKPPSAFVPQTGAGCGNNGAGSGYGCGYGQGAFGGYTGNDYGGYSCEGPDYSLMPTTQDLEWIAGDTAVFQFFFPGVAWTPVVPTGDLVTLGLHWVQTKWESQVRAPNGYYYNYWWPPLFPGYRWLMTFETHAQVVPYWQGQGAGTLVTLKGATVWPGDYVWDLQTKQWPEMRPAAAPKATDTDNPEGFNYPPKNGLSMSMMPIMGEPRPYETRTRISGKAKIHPQVTQDNIYPPSHWPVYTYPRSAVQI